MPPTHTRRADENSQLTHAQPLPQLPGRQRCPVRQCPVPCPVPAVLTRRCPPSRRAAPLPHTRSGGSGHARHRLISARLRSQVSPPAPSLSRSGDLCAGGAAASTSTIPRGLPRYPGSRGGGSPRGGRGGGV